MTILQFFEVHKKNEDVLMPLAETILAFETLKVSEADRFRVKYEELLQVYSKFGTSSIRRTRHKSEGAS